MKLQTHRILIASGLTLLIAVTCSSCADNPCPAVKSYSKEDQRVIARERNALSDNDPLKSFIDSGEALRQACR